MACKTTLGKCKTNAMLNISLKKARKNGAFFHVLVSPTSTRKGVVYTVSGEQTVPK